MPSTWMDPVASERTPCPSVNSTVISAAVAEVFVIATPPPEALRRIVIEPARRVAVTVVIPTGKTEPLAGKDAIQRLRLPERVVGGVLGELVPERQLIEAMSPRVITG